MIAPFGASIIVLSLALILQSFFTRRLRERIESLEETADHRGLQDLTPPVSGIGHGSLLLLQGRNFADTLAVNPADVLGVAVYLDHFRTNERAFLRFVSGEILEIDPNAARALIQTMSGRSPERDPKLG